MNLIQDKTDNVTVEDFARLRKCVFYNAISAIIVLAIVFVLHSAMMGSNVDDGYVYKFRTLVFINGLLYLGIMGIPSKKILKFQKKHPEWLAETSAFKNKAIEPKEWEIRRAVITASVLVTIIISFVTWYKPGTKNEFNVNEYQNIQDIKNEVADPKNNIDYQNALDIISKLDLDTKPD